MFGRSETKHEPRCARLNLHVAAVAPSRNEFLRALSKLRNW